MSVSKQNVLTMLGNSFGKSICFTLCTLNKVLGSSKDRLTTVHIGIVLWFVHEMEMLLIKQMVF